MELAVLVLLPFLRTVGGANVKPLFLCSMPFRFVM